MPGARPGFTAKDYPMTHAPLTLAIALVPGLALAETPGDFDQQLKLPALVVTASRQAEPRAQSSALTHVFTRDDIERLQPSSLLDLLNRVPGVQVTQNGGRGSLAGLSIRGTRSAQSLVLIDGQRLVDAASGIAQLEALSVAQIERIEVLRGPRSAIYGADAIGGVVQIFTRRADGPGLAPNLRVAYGNRKTWERSLGLAGGNDVTRFSLQASADSTAGIDRTRHSAPSDQDRDAWRNNAVSLNLSHRFSEELSAGLSLLDQRGESEFDLSFAQPYPYNDFQVSSYAAYLEARPHSRWNSRLELGHTTNRNVTRGDGSTLSSPFNTYRDSLAWLNTLELAEGHSLLLGGDAYQESLHSQPRYQQTERRNHAGLVQYRVSGAPLGGELGLRHDKNSQFGSQNTWNTALHLDVHPAHRLSLSYAEGFRAPSFTDLYYPDSCFPGFGCFSYANPALRPEQSKTYELQWRAELSEQTRLEAAAYRTDLRDAIVFSDIPRNIQAARINGLEAALQHQVLGWQASLALSLIDPRDRDSGRQLSRRAKRTLSADLDRHFGAFSVGAGWQMVSRSYDDAANQQEIAGYGLLGVRASWQATAELQLGLKVDNLLDKSYARALYDHDFDGQYHPYREEGRSALVSMTWTPRL